MSVEKSQGQVMATVDKEQWHAPAFQVGKWMLLHAGDASCQKKKEYARVVYWTMAKLTASV